MKMVRLDWMEKRDNGPGNKAFQESLEKPPIPVVMSSTSVNKSVVAMDGKELKKTKEKGKTEKDEESISSEQNRKEEEKRRRRRASPASKNTLRSGLSIIGQERKLGFLFSVVAFQYLPFHHCDYY